MSAPDLAKKLKLRPREVQSSLEKLSGNMMLERTLGSTDDYDNFQLTRAGAAFLFMWQRNDD
jgi:RIO-like serine/threonine protein kinase